MAEVSKYTNSNGVRRLSSLFVELCRTNEEKETAVYSLKDNDYKGYKSLFRLYMAECDPIEYTFATKNLADWTHWQMLCDATWFKPYVQRWRFELELYIKARAIAQLINESTKSTREGLAAAKFLIEKGWTLDKHTKGRPSKDDIAQAANQLAETRSNLNEHMIRIGLIDKDDGATARGLK